MGGGGECVAQGSDRLGAVSVLHGGPQPSLGWEQRYLAFGNIQNSNIFQINLTNPMVKNARTNSL